MSNKIDKNNEDIVDVEIDEDGNATASDKSSNENIETESSDILESTAEKDKNQSSNSNKKVVDTDITKTVTLGSTILIVVFGFMVGWSFFAPLDSASYATGFVTVESYRKTVQHLEGGIVTNILAKDGQLVEKDEVLLVLDETQLNAQLIINEAQYIALLSHSARLETERDGMDTITFPSYLLKKKEEEVAKVMASEKQVFIARKRAKDGEISVLKQRIEQYDEQVKGLKQLQLTQQKQIDLYEEEIAEFKELLTEGFADKRRMRDMQRRVVELEGDVAKNTSTITGSKIQKGESELRILQIEKQFQLEVAQQMSEVALKISDIKERIVAINDKITRTKIKAPVSGMVIGMTIHTLGGVIAPGKPILEIVPQGEKLIIEAQVSPVDIDKVHKGLISEVRFSSFNSATTPVIEGKVISISPDKIVDQNTGMPYYLSRIQITPEGYKNLGDLILLPGMPADVLIKIGERTVFEYLVQPVSNAFARSFIED